MLCSGEDFFFNSQICLFLSYHLQMFCTLPFILIIVQAPKEMLADFFFPFGSPYTAPTKNCRFFSGLRLKFVEDLGGQEKKAGSTFYFKIDMSLLGTTVYTHRWSYGVRKNASQPESFLLLFYLI